MFLPNRPETTKFLTEDERKTALARANRDISADVGYHVNKSRSYAAFFICRAHTFVGHIIDAFKDWRVSFTVWWIPFGMTSQSFLLRSISAAPFISGRTLRSLLFLLSCPPSSRLSDTVGLPPRPRCIIAHSTPQLMRGHSCSPYHLML